MSRIWKRQVQLTRMSQWQMKSQTHVPNFAGKSATVLSLWVGVGFCEVVICLLDLVLKYWKSPFVFKVPGTNSSKERTRVILKIRGKIYGALGASKIKIILERKETTIHSCFSLLTVHTIFNSWPAWRRFIFNLPKLKNHKNSNRKKNENNIFGVEVIISTQIYNAKYTWKHFVMSLLCIFMVNSPKNDREEMFSTFLQNLKIINNYYWSSNYL